METNVYKIEVNLRNPKERRIRVSSLKLDGTVVRTDMPYDHKEDIAGAVEFHRNQVALKPTSEPIPSPCRALGHKGAHIPRVGRKNHDRSSLRIEGKYRRDD